MGIAIRPELMEEIIRRVCSVMRPDRIILFGSAATGGMTPDSDIDLLVLKKDPGNVRDASVLIRGVLRGLGYPFDVIVMATERYEESKDVVGGLAYPVHRGGQVIYAAS